jgi:methylenetetrahydrofolate--tRNA-(uracil-5-)-methyltransferase
MRVTVVGAGLSGCEATWQLVNRGIKVDLYEMRPVVTTKAHKTGLFAELVCSNSFRGAELSQAVGLLKEELRICNSLIMQAADSAAVPAGNALAVDRDLFSSIIDSKLRQHPLVTVSTQEVLEIPPATRETPVIIAAGPLCSPTLAARIIDLCGESELHFFDAISPILYYDSLDLSHLFKQSRYGKGGGDDYLNVPLTEDQYLKLYHDIATAEKFGGHPEVESDTIDGAVPFDGCLPIEEMVERGLDTLRFGPLKGKGLVDPKTGAQPYAALQLRPDNRSGTLWSMVGMQTRMKRGEQERIFRSLPGLQNAEFARFGSVHRNTFINSPQHLTNTAELRTQAGLFFAGQFSGVEGYLESTASGLVAGINAWATLVGKAPLPFPADTAIGSLMNYISDPDRKDFQPMNINFGIMPSYEAFPERNEKGHKIPKKDRRLRTAQQALKSLSNFIKLN